MIRSGDVVMGFLPLLTFIGSLPTIVVVEEECHALEDEVLAVVGLSPKCVMNVGEADVEIDHWVIGIER